MKIKNIKNNGRCHIIGEVSYLEHIGRDFVKSAFLLYKKNGDRGSGDYFNTINLLASQALELLPKSLIATRICLDKNNKSLEEIRCAINKELGCLGHKLDNIFNEVPELQKILTVSKIKRVNSSGFIDEFRFTVGNPKNRKQIRIKNLEGARYGLFASNKDIGGNSPRDIANITGFLKNLMDKTAKIRVKMINDFDTKFGVKC